MIAINENSALDTNKVINMISRYTRGYYTMDLEMIIADRDNYKDMEEKEHNKVMKSHYGSIVKYLDGLIKALDMNNRIKVYWTLREGKLVTAPFDLQNMRWLGLDSTDYILKRDDRTVVVSYKDLWNALSIQLAHRDLDVETKDIDLKLSKLGCRMQGIDSIDKLFECAEIDNAYNQASGLKIYDTPYCSKLRGSGYLDYFGGKLKSNNYKEMIDRSIDRMMNIIITESLDKINWEESDDVEFIGVFEDRIYYNTSLATSEIEAKLAESIAIRLFGRMFEIKPEIEIY